MEPKSFSEEDTSDLKSLGFNDEHIKKLLNLSSEELKELLPSKTKHGKCGPKYEKGDYYISYTTECNLCGSKQMLHLTADCKKEWKGLHSFYQTGKGLCKVNSCSDCRKYLEGLPTNKLINIILERKEKIETSIPKIIHEEDKEHTFYPLMVVNINYCSLDEHNYNKKVKV